MHEALRTDSHKYFIQQYSHEEYQHGGIGYTDAERILKNRGYLPIQFPHQDKFSIGAKLSRFSYLFRTWLSIKKGSVVVFIFPVYAKMNRWLLKLLAKKGVKAVCFIGDINGLKDGDSGVLNNEIAFFRRFHYFIVHNDSMKEWIGQQVPGCIASPIGFFDFLVPPVTRLSSLSTQITFAGNLEKSGFLEKLHRLTEGSPSLHFHLYGPGRSQLIIQQKNVKWEGVARPYDLPGRLKGSFGLLWDGEEIDRPAGSLGDYMQYISHHKLSLYILSKLPLIVPATAASAALITRHGIGFTINSLYEIEEKIRAVSEDEYRQMQENMQQLAEKISKGHCLSVALDEILER
jgi:hypothetical protein